MEFNVLPCICSAMSILNSTRIAKLDGSRLQFPTDTAGCTAEGCSTFFATQVSMQMPQGALNFETTS